MTIISATHARLEYFGNISHTTLWNWERSIPDFPKPIRIGGRKFFLVSDLDEFVASRAGAR